MKKSNDPLRQEFADKAKRLQDIYFHDESNALDAEFTEMRDERLTRFVYPMPRMNGFRVTMSIKGKQYTIGYSKSGSDAARFADMALVRFHHLRKDSWRDLTDHDLNFSLHQVALDVAEHPEAVKILDWMVASPLFLPDAEDSNGETAVSPLDELREKILMLMDCVAGLEIKIDVLTKVASRDTCNPPMWECDRCHGRVPRTTPCLCEACAPGGMKPCTTALLDTNQK